MRLSIEITPEQHQFLKAAAAMKGESIKEYVLKRTLPDTQVQQTLKNLEEFLSPRIQAAKKGKVSTETVDTIFDQVLEKS